MSGGTLRMGDHLGRHRWVDNIKTDLGEIGCEDIIGGGKWLRIVVQW
jgi:hypothetical protein